ncbi:DUF2634 domain-containing protein [Bacillus badius]|uniref:Phage-like element PBSX protein xkdS n=1 Tax=Bacillus badius TaxID=1455 RepID=A0ABR5B1C2_BACBA|nr:DUF2634 domain-containing protein [Bacillus badius]KIL80739.1 Phage-like element PBSX protein xkdS [Bacillus badius]MED4715332.1 DUF2634 domain-containing protein [Bacillus badius]
MALSPEINIEQTEEISINELLELKTYRFDFETKRLTSELISGLEAIKQFILFALYIPRYAHPIYSADTGNELGDMLADNETTVAFKIMEIERLVTEALIYDPRIEQVYDFVIEHIDDAFHVNFKVDTALGEIEIKEVLSA